ncbi:MAG TPA: winged helix-turn-helix transcriptional regulator [Candidatus Krumholzibacteriaceae bacterium]|jgi:DNA-binding Lrp family transcriptional regulator|nr:winged helix-turn-helix transcriptional regulator [Candidatus Krumholzibacteriaceae bacterium]
MKETELKLLAELMRNSRRSDRELAKAIGVSQPTVTRMIRRLEKEGVIKEYTMIPDFSRLGYRILALIFAKLKKTLSPEETEKARQIIIENLSKSVFGIVMLERGIGLGYDGVIMAYFPDYASYVKYRNIIKAYPFVEVSGIDALLINLNDKLRYRPLTFSYLAKSLLPQIKEKKS